MYPPSVFWWIGGTVIVLGLLGILGMFVWWLDSKFQRHAERHGAPEEEDDDETRQS